MSSMSARDSAMTFFALLRHRPMVRMYSPSLFLAERQHLLRRVGDANSGRWRG
jgi:hypothetical protein